MYSETVCNGTFIVVGINEITESSAITTEVWAPFWKCLVTEIYQGSIPDGVIGIFQ